MKHSVTAPVYTLAAALLLAACRENITAASDPLTLTISPANAEIGVGDTLAIAASLQNAAGSATRGSIAYSVSDTGVATITAQGILTARAVGVAVVSARAGTLVSDTKITVLPEGQRSGSTDWRAGISVSQNDLAVWASPYSALAPDTLDVFIRSTRGTVAVSLHRLGWYGGAGGRQVWKQDGVPVPLQPACSAAFPGPVECPWAVTTRIPVARRWPSGVYMVRVEDAQGERAFYPLVIRSSTPAAFTVVVPQFTWQAYNAFGGSSLYTVDPSTGTTVPSVSFERPYAAHDGASFMFGRGGSNDISALRWLERMQYDVNYVSDLDLATPDRSFPVPTRGLIFLGHSEYWTWAEYDRVEQLRDAGRHLAFFSGNNAYWNVRVFDGTNTHRPGHLVWCAKSKTDPRATSPHEVTWVFRGSPLNRPENALYGIMYGGRLGVYAPGYYPLTVADSGIGPEAQSFLAAAGLTAGEQVPSTMGTEGDMLVANGHTPPNIQVLFRSTAPASDQKANPVVNHATFFIAPSGAGVFASGSNEFAAGLDGLYGTESPKLQALTKAILDWMSSHGG